MISVYDIGNDRYTHNGDAVMEPLDGRVRQVAGGAYDLTLTAPLDARGKWQHLVPGAIVKAPVPVETIANSFSGEDADIYKTTEACVLRDSPSEPSTINYPAWAPASSPTAYQVGSKVSLTVAAGDTRNYQCIYWNNISAYMQMPPNQCDWWKEIPRKTSGGAALAQLTEGTELYWVADENANWYEMSTYYGLTGYVKKSQVAFYKHTSAGENQPRVITDQLFRIQEPVVDDIAGTVSVTAQHVSYDLSGNLVQDVSLSRATAAMALARISAGLMIPYPGIIATDIRDSGDATYTGDLRGKSGMYCLLDPDKGVVKAFDARFTRDNWDLFVMQKSPTDRGFRIRYGKNMRGVSWKRSSASLVNRIVPIAKDEGGAELRLPEKWVDSDTISNYPVIIMEELKVNGQVGKDDGTDTGTVWTESALLDEMRAKAAERFTVDKADQIIQDVTVQMEMLGDTAEYSDLKKLENVLLYDTVKAVSDRTGMDVELTVTEIEYDIVRRKIAGVKLSNAPGWVNQRTVAGYSVKNASISSQKLAPDVAQDIISMVLDYIPEYVTTT